MSVVDASTVVGALVASGDHGRRCREVLAADSVVDAPAILRAEIASALRRLVRTGLVAEGKARGALVRSSEMQIVEHPFAPFQHRVWQLRESVSVYDAWYVALAEALGTSLVTSDHRLARAPNLPCPVEFIGPSGA